jgi:hypothetical protein
MILLKPLSRAAPSEHARNTFEFSFDILENQAKTKITCDKGPWHTQEISFFECLE